MLAARAILEEVATPLRGGRDIRREPCALDDAARADGRAQVLRPRTANRTGAPRSGAFGPRARIPAGDAARRRRPDPYDAACVAIAGVAIVVAAVAVRRRQRE